MANEYNENFEKQPLRVGFYDIEKTIGKGNFAVVKVAKHRITKSTVAIKIIDKSRLDENNLTKMRREVKIMKALRHPHVLKIYQVMETQNMLYIVSEYAANGEMFAHIDKTGRLSEEEACRVFWQILSAVEYCHKRHVVHRDLKTENLLLDEGLNIKIADFGFGNYYEENQHLKSWCGSPPYAAPEIFEGKEYFGPEVDIWSLGVVLYVLVCAALPFDGTTFPEVRDHVLSGRFRVPYFMSSELEDLIRKILIKNPTQRLTLEQIKEHHWMQQGSHNKSEIFCNQNNENNFEKGIDGELNSQILSLMKGLQIDIDATKKSVKENAYDHHCAIYYLLAERLKQHRSSYPEQRRYGTRLRRASVTADQVIIKNGLVQNIVQSKPHEIIQPIPRQLHVTPLQYALTDLHIGDVHIPRDMRSQISGCSREVISQNATCTPHVIPTAGSSYRSVACTPTIQEDIAGENDNDFSRETPQESTPVQQSKRRVRRTPILPTTTPQASQETLFVPANHPLLRVQNDSSDSTDDGVTDDQNSSYLPNGMRIQIVPPTEQLSHSLATVANTPKNEPRLLRLRPNLYPAFSEGRRASEGNPSNAPFRQVLHNSDVHDIRIEQNELLQLQQCYQRSLTPEQISQQQMDHIAYRDNQSYDHLTTPSAMEFFPVANSSLTQNVDYFGSRVSQLTNDDNNEDSEMLSLNSNGPGPFRRQHSCRKLSNSPINVAHHRNSLKRHRKQSIITNNDNVAFNVNQQDAFS
eukprot:gene18348-20191_t